MAHAYTPGLRVTESATLRRERRLPLKGDVLVSVGHHVAPTPWWHAPSFPATSRS